MLFRAASRTSTFEQTEVPMSRLLFLAVCGALLISQIASRSFADQAASPNPKQAPPDTKSATTVKTASPDAKSTPATKTTQKSLYERLGGEKAISAVADDFVGRMTADSKVNFTRKGTPKEWKATPENLTTLKKHLTQYICHATGGPQKYEGKDIKIVHKGMEITDAEFDAAAADLSASLDKLKVPKTEHDELMKIVGTTRADIVEKKLGPPATTPAPIPPMTTSKK